MKLKVHVFIGLFILLVVSCCNEEKSNSEANDGAVKDWSEISSDEMSYTDAYKYCEDLKEDGTSNWRLPKISELRSLITGCELTETGGNCKVTDDCVSFEIPCMDDSSCNGCITASKGYSKLGDKALILSGSWFDYYPDCDGCDYVSSETYAAGVDFRKAAVTFENSGFVRCMKIMKGDKREIACTEKPLNSYWNWTSEITQEWDGNKWTPSNISTYNKELSQEECRFNCNNVYKWDENSETCKSTIEYPWTDPDTKLEWSNAGVFSSLVDIKNFCNDMDEGGHTDWRIPHIDELRTLVTNCPQTETDGECVPLICPDDSCMNESCNGCNYDRRGIYSKLGDSYYLISSNNSVIVDEYENSRTFFLYINFLYGKVLSEPSPGLGSNVRSVYCRCVRG